MASEDKYDPGVRRISWAGSPTDVDYPHHETGIPVDDPVVRGQTWFATYTFDPENQTLYLDRPTTFEPEPPASDPPDGAPTIVTLSIDRWGSGRLHDALRWEGPVRGVVRIEFEDTKVSGPIGTVNGP